MSKILHLLCSEPDEIVAALVTSLTGSGETSVICLYPDGISANAVDWHRVVEAILAHEKTICWW